ncbi:MAG TPA: penicillin-binding protein 2 [Anaeromyxobacteraceae bacterium]
MATVVLSLAFLVLAGRLYQLQILRGDEYKGRADENFVKELRVPADRGLLLDRNRRVLVDSRPSYDVALIPYFCGKQCGEVVARLATMLSLGREEESRVRDHLKRSRGLERFRPFTVKVDIGRDDLDVLEANHMELSGAVEVIPNPHRHYRHGTWASHLLGYMNEVGAEELERENQRIAESGDELPYQLGDYIGRRGLERRFEAELRGVDGKQRVVVDARGNALRGSDLIPEAQRHEPSQPGLNLVLSLDWRLQEFAERIFPAKAGAVLAMDPKTGFLLALVDRPASDPNKLSGRITKAELAEIAADPLQPELFRAIQQHYHPGSTFKVVTAVAALEEGVFKKGGSVWCPGHFTMGRYRWRCDKDSGHGKVDLEHALGASCDVFFYTLGEKLGADRIARHGGNLGLGRPTGLDIADREIPGVMPDVAWHDAHLAGGYQQGMAVNLAIGQGDVNVTPLQQLVLYGALASGIVWRPQVALRLEDARGEVVREFAPEERGRLAMKPETREAVMQGLLAAVNQRFGTGWWSRLSDVVMAGKTGTAQVVKMGATRRKASEVSYFERDHAWFAAFAPADDPQVVVVVLNEHSGFGASNAAPTASAVVKKWIEIQKQDEAERTGAGRPAEPAPAGPPPPPSGPARPEKPSRDGTRAAAGRGADHGA